MPKALTLSGSIRAGSYNVQLALAMGHHLEAHGAEVEYLDLRTFPMPIFDEDLEGDSGVPENAYALADRFAAADIIFIASPEYNGSVTPLVKNTIDWLTHTKRNAFKRAVFGIGSASSGKLAGVVGLSHLRDILAKINAVTAPTAIGVGPHVTAFDNKGRFADDIIRKRADMLADQLMRLSKE